MSINLFLRQQDSRNCYYSIQETLETDAGGSYEISERIKAGGNGVVHRCFDRTTGIEYAIKFQLEYKGNRLKRFQREQKLLQELKHDHLVTYQGHGKVSSNFFNGSKKSSSQEISFVIMELAEENLFTQIQNKKIESETYFAQFRGLTRALAALHEYAIHRDIKPDNILISGDKWLLSDYGLCTFLENDIEDNQLTRNNEIVGPRFWMSPEANNRNVGCCDEIDKSSDVFQLAAVFWFCVNKTHPTGILTKNDWKGPEKLFKPIFNALHYDKNIRPKDGAEFSKQIENAIIS